MIRTARARQVVAALVVVCLLVVDPGGMAPSGVARHAALAVVLAMAAATLAADPGAFRPGRAPLLRASSLSWAALVGLVAASVLAGADRLHGVFGTSERGLGLLAWVGFAVAFHLGAALPRPGGNPLARVAFPVLVAVVGLAGLEAIGLDPTGTAWTGTRVGAPFAQSTYLGVALVLLVPLVGGRALDDAVPVEGPAGRAVAGAVGVAGLVTLAATQARGPILGLGAAVLAVLWWRGRRREATGVAVASLLVVVGVSLVRGWGSLGGRLDEWAVGGRGVAAAPILGFGPEGYRHRFPGLVDADYVRDHGAEAITDRAHSGLLDVALSSGVVAAVVLGALWVIVLLAARRVVRAESARPSEIALAVAVLAGLAQQLVLFPLADLDPVLWLLAGALVTASTKEPGSTEEHDEVVGSAASGRTRLLARAVPAAAVPALLLAGWWHATTAVAEHRLAGAGSFRQVRAEEAADAALSLRPESVRLVYAVARIHAEGPTLVDLDEAIDILEAALDLHPADPALRTEYALRLVERARRSGLGADADEAVLVTERIAEDAPNDPRVLGLEAEALLLAGRAAEARAPVLAALDLAPDDPGLRALAETIEES